MPLDAVEFGAILAAKSFRSARLGATPRPALSLGPGPLRDCAGVLIGSVVVDSIGRGDCG